MGRSARATLVAAGLALAVLAATACSAPATRGPGREPPPADTPLDPGGELSVATITLPTGFDPHRERQAGERPATFLIYDRLTRVDAELTAGLMLAVDWTAAADGRSLTMRLRTDVRFHDGTPFDAEAVRINIERARTLPGSTSAEDLAAVDEVTVLAPDQVRFDLVEPRPDLPEILAGPAGAMISPRAIASGRDLAADPGTAGTGGYVVSEFVPNERVVFTRASDANWDPQAGRLERLELRYIADDRTRDSALRAGEVDVAYVNPFDANSVKQAEALGRGGRFVHYSSGTAVLSALLLRSSQVPDPRLRQAVVQAVDRDPIVHGLLQNTCTRSDQLIPAGYPGHVPDFTDPYPYDPDAARRLLADAAPPGGFELEISFIAGRASIPEVLQQQLAEVGIRARLTPLTSIEVQSAYRQDRIPSWSFQVTPDLSPRATIDFVLSPGGVGGNSAAVAAARDSSRAATTPEAREHAYQDASIAIAREAFFVPLCHVDAHWLAGDRVVGLSSAPVPYANYMIDLRHVGVAADREAS